MAQQIRLYGKVFVTGDIRALSGLHIGGGDTELSIGGIDNPVIRSARTNRPYIPGSSLKGKMRSLLEKVDSRPQNVSIGRDVNIHVCQNKGEYENCDVCHIFGVPGDKEYSSPTRLAVRDILLDPDSLKDIPYTEVKWEASIDRVTSAAVPRSLERVPEGAVFKPFELCYGVYEADDARRLKKVFEAMQLVEDDYLGGSGTRGSGKIRFENIQVGCRSGKAYGATGEPIPYGNGNGKTELPLMKELLENQDSIVEWLKKQLFEE